MRTILSSEDSVFTTLYLFSPHTNGTVCTLYIIQMVNEEDITEAGRMIVGGIAGGYLYPWWTECVSFGN